MGDLIFWIQTKHHTEFSINSRFNTRLNLKDKVTLEFGIILSLTLIVSEQIGLDTRFQTEGNLSVDLNRYFAFRLR